MGSKMNVLNGNKLICALNKILIIRPNKRKLDLGFFFFQKVVISVRSGHCGYSPRSPKKKTGYATDCEEDSVKHTNKEGANVSVA